MVEGRRGEKFEKRNANQNSPVVLSVPHLEDRRKDIIDELFDVSVKRSGLREKERGE